MQIWVRVGETLTPLVGRTRLQTLMLAVADVIDADRTLSGRVCDCQLLRARRGWANVGSVLHAVGWIPVLANDSGD